MSQIITFCVRTMSEMNGKIKKKKQKLNYTQTLSETSVNKLFLHLKRMKK